ncbi:MAG: hypothetical protein HZA93_24590 [Verrucomicrobia bacterium]|nr:hypothetical protein [Verrucomicrobiota bacterium]
MTTRPLELASRLQPAPRNLDWIFYVNAGLLVFFFTVFGSRFVVAPGLRIEQMPGARASASPTTHYVSISSSGMIFANRGPISEAGLRDWLAKEGTKTKDPSLLVIAGAGVLVEKQAAIVSAATAAGFRVVWAFEEPVTGADAARAK